VDGLRAEELSEEGRPLFASSSVHLHTTLRPKAIVAVQEQSRGISISRNGGVNWFTPYEDRSFHKFRYVACDANCATIAVTEYVPPPSD
jgi:hypothetical protein